MYIIDFFNKYNGKYVDTDGMYGAQCMDLYNKYQIYKFTYLIINILLV